MRGGWGGGALFNIVAMVSVAAIVWPLVDCCVSEGCKPVSALMQTVGRQLVDSLLALAARWPSTAKKWQPYMTAINKPDYSRY